MVCSRSQSQWEVLVKDFVESGATLGEFASSVGVDAQSLEHWVARLRPAGVASPDFVEVVVDDVPEASAAFGRVDVALPSGVRLSFEHPLDLGGLRQLAAAFGEAG